MTNSEHLAEIEIRWHYAQKAMSWPLPALADVRWLIKRVHELQDWKGRVLSEMGATYEPGTDG